MIPVLEHSGPGVRSAIADAPTWTVDVSLLPYRFPSLYREPVIVVDIRRQDLSLWAGNRVVGLFPVSTSRWGAGAEEGSLKTPLGIHRIVARIGSGAGPGTVFRGRRPTSDVVHPYSEEDDGREDLITTRILQLEGLEPGINRGAGIDSVDRYIYIHGTPHEARLGQPASIGCVRAGNRDMIDIFERVPDRGLVLITNP